MRRYLLRRSLDSVVLIFLVSLVTFLLIQSAPGDPTVLQNPNLSEAQVAEMARNLGLDRPWYQQYFSWLGNVFQGDLGRSYATGELVGSLIGERWLPTLWLSGAALGLAVIVGLPLGIVAATRPLSLVDYTATVVSVLGLCIPGFWLGIMLILVFSVRLGVLPAGGISTEAGQVGGIDLLRHLILPSVVLAASPMAQLSRYTRSNVYTTLRDDYVRTALAKGLGRPRVLYVHVLRNAAIPVVTTLGILLPRVVSGAVITETVFAWPGIGRLAIDSAFQRDYPVIMGVTLVVSVAVILANFATDVLYGFIDPRIGLR